MAKYACSRGITAVLFIMLAFVIAGAQEFRGSITGKVTDPNDAVVPGAEVSIKNVETNVVTTATTNEEGAYSFPLLAPGNYTLTVTREGFNTAVREGVVVRVADKLTLDVKMDIGVAATVTTVAGTPVLETGSVSTGTTIEPKQIRELPLSEGTPYQLATLAPGIAYTGNPQFTGPTSNGNLAAFRSNGATVGPNQITLDGTPNYAFEGGVGFSPPSEAVQEFKIQTNAFDAQQGYSAGATVNVAVRSGTNDLRGSVWYFNRDKSRTANNFFGNRTGQSRPDRTYHRFGGVIGGPVYIPGVYNGKDRTFFFTSYERLKDTISEPQLFTVPTLKMRQGDFSEFLTLPTPVVIYDPATAKTSGSNVVRTPFANNKIDPSRFNPVAAALLKYYPEPNAPGTANGTQNNFFSPNYRKQNYRAWLTRIDHKISDTQTIFGKYYHSFNPEDRQDWAGVVNGFPITQGFEYRTNDGGNVDYTNTLSPTMVLDLRVGFNRFQQERRPAATFDPATLGFSQTYLNEINGYQYIPLIAIRNLDATRPSRSNLGAARSDWNGGRLRPFYMGSIQPTLTQISGNHTLRYGYDLRVLRENFVSPGYQGGRFFFDGTFTTASSSSSTSDPTRNRNLYGRDFAAFLLGLPSTGSGSNTSQIENPITYSVQQLYHGWFVQDDWRVNPKLTLNLGLRYELEMGLTERYNRLARGFDATTPSPINSAAQAAYTTAYNANPSNFVLTPSQFQVLGGFNFANADNRALWDADKSNWQPRFGAAYQLDEKTVLRGGLGIFMAPFQLPTDLADTTNQTSIQPGFSGSTPFVPTTNNGLTFAANLSNPFPNGLQSSPGSSLGLLTNIGQDIGATDAPVIPVDRKNAKFARMVLGIQRELPGQFVLEANYVTAWGYDLPVTRNINFIPRPYLGTDPTSDTAANNFLFNVNITNPFRNLVPASPTLNSATTVTRGQLLLPFPQFNNVYVEQYNGTNRYNALQLQVTRRFAASFSLSSSYTYSRLRERVDYLNPSDTELEDRVSTIDRPHRFTFSGVFELPFGRGRAFGKDMNRVLDAVIGGWQLNGTYEWQSGEPFLLAATQVWFYPGDPRQIVSRVGQSNSQGQRYGIDVSAFEIPSVNGQGLVRLNNFNTGLRNVPTTLDTMRNQPFLNVNLSLTKNFKFGETKKLQIRMEAINAFNHPYFGNGINLDPSSASFGLVTTQRNNPRDIQIGAKFTF